MQVAVQIEPEQVSWIVARASSLGWNRSLEAEVVQVELVDERIGE